MARSQQRVLPSSRQPVPVADEVQEQLRERAETRRRHRSVDEIERELDETTQRLAANVDELVDRVSPVRLAQSGVEKVKARVMAPSGRPRPEVIGAIAGAAIVGVVLWQLRRRG